MGRYLQKISTRVVQLSTYSMYIATSANYYLHWRLPNFISETVMQLRNTPLASRLISARNMQSLQGELTKFV